MKSLKLTLPLPPGVNNQYATVGRRRVLSRDARTFRRSVAGIVQDGFKTGRIRQPWIEAVEKLPLACDITFYFTTPYRRDLDGGLKIALDALLDTLGLDDRYVVSITLTKQIDPLNPRAEIELAAIDDWQFDETYVVLDSSDASTLSADESNQQSDGDQNNQRGDDRNSDE